MYSCGSVLEWQCTEVAGEMKKYWFCFSKWINNNNIRNSYKAASILSNRRKWNLSILSYILTRCRIETVLYEFLIFLLFTHLLKQNQYFFISRAASVHCHSNTLPQLYICPSSKLIFRHLHTKIYLFYHQTTPFLSNILTFYYIVLIDYFIESFDKTNINLQHFYHLELHEISERFLRQNRIQIDQ